MDDATAESARQDTEHAAKVDTQTGEAGSSTEAERTFSPFAFRADLQARFYPEEVRQVADRYRSARRALLVTLGLCGAGVVLMAVSAFLSAPEWLTLGSGVVIVTTATQWAGYVERHQMAGRWLASLRRAAGYPPLGAGVSLADYARAVVAGHHVGGETENALLALWLGQDTAAEELAREVLMDYEIPDPSAAGSPYHRDVDSSTPLWHRDGVPWHSAPAPAPGHACTVWSMGVVDPGEETEHAMFRCACSSASINGWEWAQAPSPRTGQSADSGPRYSLA